MTASLPVAHVPESGMEALHYSAMSFVYVVLFGIVGVLLRYGCNILFASAFQTSTAYSTLLVNMVGSFLVGIMQGYFVEREQVSLELRFGLMVGLLGGLTSFSGYVNDTLVMLEHPASKWDLVFAALNLTIVPSLGLLLAYCGASISRA